MNCQTKDKHNALTTETSGTLCEWSAYYFCLPRCSAGLNLRVSGNNAWLNHLHADTTLKNEANSTQEGYKNTHLWPSRMNLFFVFVPVKNSTIKNTFRNLCVLFMINITADRLCITHSKSMMGFPSVCQHFCPCTAYLSRYGRRTGKEKKGNTARLHSSPFEYSRPVRTHQLRGKAVPTDLMVLKAAM